MLWNNMLVRAARHADSYLLNVFIYSQSSTKDCYIVLFSIVLELMLHLNCIDYVGDAVRVLVPKKKCIELSCINLLNFLYCLQYDEM